MEFREPTITRARVRAVATAIAHGVVWAILALLVWALFTSDAYGVGERLMSCAM